MTVFRKNENIMQDRSSDIRPIEKNQSVIGKTLFIKGKLLSDEEVLIEGNFEGILNVKHRVIVSKSGKVNADVEAREIIIKGFVNGNVKCSDKVEIVPDGILNGNIISQRVVLAEGAVFKGNIDMTPGEEKTLDIETETDKSK